MEITQKEAVKLLKEWQNRLFLNDWRIKLYHSCSPEEMEQEGGCGCATWTEATKVAKIQILDEQYYGERVIPFDFEKTLVHELMHLKVSLLVENDNDLQERLMHQLIDDMARSLVDTKRCSH